MEIYIVLKLVWWALLGVLLIGLAVMVGMDMGVGAGLRLYLRNIVLPLVGVDAAYSVNSGEFRLYLVAGVNPS